jgi:hypothetical protein
MERVGFTVWFYERDNVPGQDYLTQVAKALEECKVVIVIVSPKSLRSRQVTNEIVTAYEGNKPFIPVLKGVTHDELREARRDWRQCFGASTSIRIPEEGLVAIVPRIAQGLEYLGIKRSEAPGPPEPKPTAEPTLPESNPDMSASCVTRVTVFSEIDADIYVDGRKVTTIDHTSGFDYASGRMRWGPTSKLTIKSHGFERIVEVRDLCNTAAEDCRFRIGTGTLADVLLTKGELRTAMGSDKDIPDLLRGLRNETECSVRAWSATRLGYIGGSEAIAGLLDALADPDPWVQASAAQALGIAGDPSVLAIVRKAHDGYERKDSYGWMFEAAIKDLEFAQRVVNRASGRTVVGRNQRPDSNKGEDTMATKKIFISYDYDNDKHWKTLLLAWSKNPGFADFYINDQSVTVAVDSDDSGPIKRVISAKIGAATGFLCIVGEKTYRSGWVDWEIKKAVELGKRMIAVKTAKDNVTPTALHGVGATWALSFTLDSIKKAIDEAYK